MTAASQAHDTPYLRACNDLLEGVLRLHDLDALWARLQVRNDGSWCVYADDHAEPAFVKIFDPGNLGAACGFSAHPPLPGWTLSRLAPDDLTQVSSPPRGRDRRWPRILG